MKIILAFLAFLFFLPPVWALDCTLRITPCKVDEVELFSMYNSTNAHAAEPSYYAYKVCCTDIVSSTIRTECAADEVEILSLYDEVNAHAARPGYYPYKVCVNWLNCTLRPVCEAWEVCTASLYDLNNSHVAACGRYDWQLCCGECDASQDVCFTCCQTGVLPGCGITPGECTLDSCWSLGGDLPGGSYCCGDDDAEYRLSCQTMWGVVACLGGAADVACCHYADDCVYADTCYRDGWTGDVDADGYSEMCDAGIWIRPPPVWKILWRDLLRIISRIIGVS